MQLQKYDDIYLETYTTTISICYRIFHLKYHTESLEQKQTFVYFQGNELELFVDNIEVIVSFLTNTFIHFEHLFNIIAVLDLWSNTVKFLSIKRIENNTHKLIQIL